MSSSYDAAMIDTALIEDERLLTVQRGIRLLHIEAMVWSKLHRTDGRILAAAIRRFTDEPDPQKPAQRSQAWACG